MVLVKVGMLDVMDILDMLGRSNVTQSDVTQSDVTQSNVAQISTG